VRWEVLLADLEAEFDAAEAAELAAEVSDRTRSELARLRLVDRLRAGVGTPIAITVPHLGAVRGRITQVGPDWLLLADDAGRESLVPLTSALTISGLGPRAVEPDREGAVTAGLGLRYALRLLARDRAQVAVTLQDGRTISGRVDRVGADFIDVLEQTLDGRRRDARSTVVPFGALVVIRSV
jgi:hypothetical protein